MKYILLALAALAVLSLPGCSQDDFLNPSDSAANAAAKQDIKETMGGEDLFKSGKSSSGTFGPTGAPKASVAPSTSSWASAAGTWHLDLSDSSSRMVDMVLYQSEDALFGKGAMVMEGRTQAVAATGLVSGSEIMLDLLALDDLSLFTLDLSLNGQSVSGGYMAYSPNASPWLGIALGTISA